MKKLILSVLTFTTMVAATIAEERLSFPQLNYGVEINQFSTGSGFKSGFEASAYVLEGNRRSLQLGLYFDGQSNKLTGFSVQHKYIIFKNKIERSINVEPYLFYNFVFRSTQLGSPVTSNPELAAAMGYGTTSYTSIEHHIGLGFKVNILRSVFLHADAGYGRYLGSIMRPSAPDPLTGLMSGTSGWNIITKVGIGYNF